MTTRLMVTRTEDITPGLRRVWFHSDDLSAFDGSSHTDRYVKLIFARDGQPLPDSVDVRAMRRDGVPAEQLPDVRTYTALFPDVGAGTVAIDFVIHGDEGVAGPWAARAVPGQVLHANGPGGGYRPDPSADWHLLIGDESAVPAITAALAELGPEPTVRLLLAVPGPDHELALSLGPDQQVRYVNDASALVAAVRELPWLAGRVQVFAHGEAQAIMHGVRPYLLKERGVPRSDASISGYWRQGRSEDAFRVWKQELAAAERVE
ncbi:NADPH-dependent ferric siderophore reductase [Branchiibius hedensis]|uniref:NADPH-dependent ferric siderophore reductase, contains FAD-binding and SIP domains n=1 Tax=Branchiibius hedensis TaxID=672460 RepID=A0A2Y9BT95_9MICO|nr:siderophore-interacting protein [Branchiibius hedensis]PWJ24846.1 NADPH-dependent ferric siderophore reductase [Branchiibius hedensis]SSA33662.1 NADPH-dependent ferric siderophore reductase, contains FAD-binding and SIP domains [Branchiibius hedensis]